MSAVRTAGVLDSMPSICVYAWPKHIIMQHLLGHVVAMFGLSLSTGRTTETYSSEMKWKHLRRQSFHDVLQECSSLQNSFHSPHYMRMYARTHTHTHAHTFCGSFFRFPPQGQNHIHAFSIVWGKRDFHAHFLLPQCIPNPILFPILQAKYYHQSTANISVLAVSRLPQTAFVGWNLFVPYKTKIYNNSQSVNTYNSSSPSTYRIYHLYLWQSGLLCPV